MSFTPKNVQILLKGNQEPTGSDKLVFNGSQILINKVPLGASTSNSSVINFLGYYSEAATGTNDLTTPLQNFLLYCQVQAIAMKSTSLDDQVQRTCVNAYLPRGRYTVTSPLIVPEYVNLICDGIIVRNGQSGNTTLFYTGDTTSQALGTLYLPTVVMVPRSHGQKISIYSNSNGSDKGSGLAIGKTWSIKSANSTITAAGTGYTVNDVLTVAQPSLSPYKAATYTVTSTNGSGGITGITGNAGNGAYGLPPVLQTQQWTTANGFAGTFDSHGNLAVTGGTGTGASINHAWSPDYDSSTGKSYYMGVGSIISDYLVEHVNVVGSQRLFDNTTYGSVFNVLMYGLNGKYGEFEVQAGFRGMELRNCSDAHFSKINTVDCETGVYLQTCSNMYCPTVVIDTPEGDASALNIDDCVSIRLEGNIFNRQLSNLGSQGPACIALGAFSSGSLLNENVTLKFQMIAAGTQGDSGHLSSIGSPALSVDYSRGYDIDIHVSNREFGWVGHFPVVEPFVVFGGHNIGHGRIRGSTEMMYGALTSGTIPPFCQLDIMDADVPIVVPSITATITGTATAGDKLQITFTNTDLASSYNWPVTATYTVAGGDSTTAMATGVAAAINGSVTLAATGVVATSSSNVVTIYQVGYDANFTTITKAIVGAGTEAIALSASGVMSGGISGGMVKMNGIYELSGSGAPTNGVGGTGYTKAGKGSTYIDYATPAFYQNTGTAASPSWTQIS